MQLLHSVVCTVLVYHAIVYKLVQHKAHTYTVKLYSDVSVAVTTIIRHENSPDQKTPLFQGVSLVTHTSLYFASPFNTELFVSHFPRVSFVHTEWKLNYVTSLKGCKLRVSYTLVWVLCRGRRHRSVCSNRHRRLYGAQSHVCAVLAELRITERRPDSSPWSNANMSGFSLKLNTAYKSGQIICRNTNISR
jgi:hypothetical protein